MLNRALSAIERQAPKLSAILKKKLLLPHQLSDWSDQERSKNRSIATINGCFDLLHLGHLHMLLEGKAQADSLLLALNTDEIISSHKGAKRPIHQLHERLLQVSVLACVDFVTFFQQSDPVALLQLIRPNVHVNGSEYGIDCIESAAVMSQGGRLHLVEPLMGYSTTGLIAKLQKERK